MKTRAATPIYVGLARPARLGALLRVGPEPLSVVWSNPSRGLHVTGLGVAGEGGGDVTWLAEPPARPPPGPWFGGWAFDARRAWSGFDAERWVLPEVLAWWADGQSWLAAFGPAGTPREALLARLGRVEEQEPVLQAPGGRVVAEDRPAFEALVRRGLEAIGRGELEKVVLARRLVVESPRPFSERAVLKALEARHPQCWTFLVRGRDGRAFVGASPETLCEVTGDELAADALAGTAPLGQGDALLGSDKERREHGAVVEGICEALAPFTLEVTHPPAPMVKQLANVAHLHTPIRARVKGGVRALDVARALHPTPAVAGRPTAQALGFLAEAEGFSRGWYAGAVGAHGPSGLTLAVALRSALLGGARAEVFVGAGVVAGSTPEGEWVETERKARAVLPALGVERG